MWRRHGDAPYTLLVVGAFTLEVLALSVLVWTFSLRLGGLASRSRVDTVLVGAVVTTALALLSLTLYTLGYHALSAIRERHEVGQLEAWTERWIAAVFLQGTAPEPPLSRQALGAGLELRELLKGDEGRALGALLQQAGVAGNLIRRLGARRLATRLDALDGLAKGRFSETFHPLLGLLNDEEGAVRLMAGRAVARILADWPAGRERRRATAEFTEAMRTTGLPAGAAGEVLLLLEDAARPVLASLLSSTSDHPRILRAALDATGRLGLIRLKRKVAASIPHPDPEVRAAALRALSKLGPFPRHMADYLIVTLDDRTEFVRVQAARAAVGLPQKLVVPLLYQHIADRSWWVRRAAAESLLRLGRGGLAALRRAADGHSDRFARDMAAQVLADAGENAPPESFSLELTA